MERYTPAEESGEGSPDAPTVWARAQEAKKPAFILRLELQTYVDGTTTTLLDARLKGADLPSDARDLVRRSLVNPRNARVRNLRHQTVDLLVLLASEQGLTDGGAPKQTDLVQMLDSVMDRACAYGAAASQTVGEHLGRSRRGVRRLRTIVGTHAVERLQDTVLAELFFRGLQPDVLGPAERTRLAVEAEGGLLVRHAVMAAAVEMSCRAGEHAAQAWSLAADAARNPYLMIVDRGDSRPFTQGPAMDLERLARREAETVGILDDGVFQAVVRFTVKSFNNELKTITEKVRRIRHFEQLAGPVGDTGGETPETYLDRVAATAAAVEPALDPADDPLAWIATGVGMVERGETPAPQTERAVLIDDLLALLRVCRIITENDAVNWLTTWYHPVSRTTVEGGLASVWSLCQAARPHYVKWPGYPERQSDRQRRFVADVAGELQRRRMNEEGEGRDGR